MSRVIVDNKSFSLSEWYQQINHQLTHGLRAEDNKKRERLEVLFKTIGLRYDRPDKFAAETVARRQPEFLTYLKKNKNRFCAFSLVPQDAALPKLRMRGKTVSEALKWLDGQSVDFSKYDLEIVPHSEVTLWASIFMIQPQGIIGEVVQGGLNLLSMGKAATRPIFLMIIWPVILNFSSRTSLIEAAQDESGRTKKSVFPITTACCPRW